MIELDTITKTYRRRGSIIRALDGVSLPFDTGFTALIGPNGGGKSTLMNIAATLVRPTSGTVHWDGKPLAGKRLRDYRTRVGYVPQHVRFPVGMTCRDALRYMGWVNGIPGPERDRRAEELAERLQFSSKLDAKTGALSGGQQQRLGIAAGIMNRPEIIFLDEPTVGLDPENRLTVRGIISELAQETSVVMSSHMLEDIRYISGRLVMISEGRLIYRGTWKDLATKIPDISSTEGSSFELAYRALVDEAKGGRHAS